MSDSHVQDDDAADLNMQRLQELIAHIVQLAKAGVPLDFVVHTGDLVNEADAPESMSDNTGRALELMDQLPVPWFLLNGNHDKRDFLHLQPPDWSDRGTIAVEPFPGISRYVMAETELLFINANPEDGEQDIAGRLPASQLLAMQQILARSDNRVAVFLHYPPLCQEAPWVSAPAGGEALHQLLRPHASRLAGVFCGHVHRATHHLADGILYVSAPAIARQFYLWPGQQTHADTMDCHVGFHYVTFDGSGTRVQHHSVNSQFG